MITLRRIVGSLSLVLILAQVLLRLVSWLLSATMMPGVRSLLSPEGLRWYAGQFTHLLLTPLLSWLLLLSMSAGCFLRSGLGDVLRSPATYRERLALRVVLVLLILYIGVIVLLVAAPHAVLLSATGRLWPSPFSMALVPIGAFGVVLVSAVYGVLSNHFGGFSDVIGSLIDGLQASAPLLFLYLLAVQFYASLMYVLMR